jgi:hypothetical protein
MYHGAMAAVLAEGALLTLAPFVVIALYGRGRAVRWDVVVVGAIAFVISEPFRILTAPIFGAAAVWQTLALYIPLRAYGVRERDEPVTLGIAYGGAMAVSAGIAVLLRLPAATTAPVAAAAVLGAAAAFAMAPGLALFAAEAVRGRQIRWLLAVLALSVLGAIGLPELVAAAIATWWLARALPPFLTSDRTH